MNEKAPRTIEQQANYEGNHTLLLVSRVQDPVIREQIINFLLHDETTYVGETLRPDPVTGRYVRGPYIPATRSELEKRLDENIERAMDQTQIDLDETHEMSSALVMKLNCILPWTGKKPTAHQQNIIESHEKGHIIRPYVGKGFKKYFIEGFDTEEMPFSTKDVETLITVSPESYKGKSFDQIKKSTQEYLFEGGEIAERMSQLKNYFGMTGSENFTKEHLAYARLHYVEDTGIDNLMTHFFAAITPETEERFLEIINSIGI